MPGPLVSIIVPTRNSSRFLSACLESLRLQTYSNIETIIVDNHSTDETEAIARQYTDIFLTFGPERSAQVNFGAQHARGEYIYKVDSDFVLEAGVIESCVHEMTKGYDAIVVHNSPDVRVGWIARVRRFEVDMYKYDLAHSSARFLSKNAFYAIGGFDETMTAGEDYDFQNRLNAAGYKTGFVAPEALHLGEPTSFINHMKKYFDYGASFLAFADKNSTAQLRFVRPVYFRNWRQFAYHPVRGSLFIVYATCKFAAGGAGFLTARAARLMGRSFK